MILFLHTVFIKRMKIIYLGVALSKMDGRLLVSTGSILNATFGALTLTPAQ